MPTTNDSLSTDGPVLLPGDAGHDDERAGYNLIVEHHPAVIVGATGPADVVAAVSYARDYDLAIAVQATGHGASVPADGAVLINTRRMDGVEIDPVHRTARIEAGVRSRQLVREAAVHGLAPLNGSAPDVGTVSYILGGGVGMLGRRYGYAADHVRSIDVVTADGALRKVSAEHDQDLFWALRGGKGNFGVVVAMEIDLFPVARLYGGGLWFDAHNTPNALHAYTDWVQRVPEDMGSSVLLIHLPDFPGIPAPIRGKFVTHIRIAYIGSKHEGLQWVQQLRDAAPPLLDTVGDMPYSDVGTIHDEPTTPVPFYAKNTMLANIDHDAIDALLENAGPATNAPYLVELRHLAGAFSRPPLVANAIGRRDGKFVLYTGSVTPRPTPHPPTRPQRTSRRDEPVEHRRRLRELPVRSRGHQRRTAIRLSTCRLHPSDRTQASVRPRQYVPYQPQLPANATARQQGLPVTFLYRVCVIGTSNRVKASNVPAPEMSTAAGIDRCRLDHRSARSPDGGVPPPSENEMATPRRRQMTSSMGVRERPRVRT